MRVSLFLLRWLLVPIVAVWAVHMFQRRSAAVAGRKRLATLYLTAVLIAIWAAAWVFARLGVRDVFLVPVAALAAALVAWKRAAFLPFGLTCGSCGARLPAKRILFHDSPLCENCETKKENPP
jgi:hypothetical protein